MSYARYRVFAAGTGFAEIRDMGASWGGSVSGTEFANGDTPFELNEQERHGRDWTPPAAPYWDGYLRDATQAEIDARAATVAITEAERLNTPIVFDQPIEAPTLVLQSHSAGIGVGIVAADDGELTTFTYHASPVPSVAGINARKDAAIAIKRARKAKANDKSKPLNDKQKVALLMDAIFGVAEE